jgi:hypothetical protein
MLLHHRLRVAAAWSTTVLLRILVMLLRRTVMTLVWLRVRSSHWGHWSDVSGCILAKSGMMYLTEVASGTSGELARQAACTSSAAADDAPVVNPDGSSSAHLVSG